MIERLLPMAASEHAADLDAVLYSVHAHMAVQAIAWGAFFIYCLVRFRAGRNPQPAATGPPSLLPMVAIALVITADAVLLATAALPAWYKRTSMPSFIVEPLEVRVIGEQFAWNVHYPGPDRKFGLTRDALLGPSNPLGIDRADPSARDDIGILNILTVPLGRPVIVHLTSRDVIHSFTLNEMRVKQDAVPGLTARTWFTPTVEGQWEIACSQLCGLGHYRMRGDFSVVAQARWDQWQQSELALIERSLQR